jgi:hypothetical protein
MSIIICGSVNGDLRIKRDAYCRCAQRRFRNALLFIAVENNREGGARVARAAWSHVLFSRRKRDRAGSGLRQSQRKRVIIKEALPARRAVADRPSRICRWQGSLN